MKPSVEAQIERSFAVRPNPTAGQKERIELIRESLQDLSITVAVTSPHSREQNLALRHLEEAFFWYQAAIQRHESS